MTNLLSSFTPRTNIMRYTEQSYRKRTDTATIKLEGSDSPPATLKAHSLDYERCQTEKCLQICIELLCRIDEAHLQFLQDSTRSAAGEVNVDESTCSLTKAHLMTAAALQEGSCILNQTLSQLYSHLGEIKYGPVPILVPAKKNLVMRSSHTGPKGSLRLGNINLGKDSRQTIIHTPGEILEIKNATAGDRALQFIGTVSDVEPKHG